MINKFIIASISLLSFGISAGLSAAESCIDISGTYAIDPRSCDQLSDGGYLNWPIFASIYASSGDTLTINQKDCSEITLKLSSGGIAKTYRSDKAIFRKIEVDGNSSSWKVSWNLTSLAAHEEGSWSLSQTDEGVQLDFVNDRQNLLTPNDPFSEIRTEGVCDFRKQL